MQEYRDESRNNQQEKLKVNNEGLTVTGLQLERYMQLIECEKELHRLKVEIATCARVNTKEIDKKEKAYREEQKKINEKFWEIGGIAEDERKKLSKIESEWLEEMDRPEIIVDSNKAANLISKYIRYGMKLREQRKYGFEDGTPSGSRIKIE